MAANKSPLSSQKQGIFNEFVLRIKLIIRLMGDKRVNPLIKLLPVGSLMYFVIPDLIPTPIDDALVLWLGGFLFVELCPPDIVQEHMASLNNVIPGEWHDSSQTAPSDQNEEVIDAEWWEKK